MSWDDFRRNSERVRERFCFLSGGGCMTCLDGKEWEWPDDEGGVVAGEDRSDADEFVWEDGGDKKGNAEFESCSRGLLGGGRGRNSSCFCRR